jgi:TonB-linked SusC/RagA family outer membrane protein
MNNFIKTANTWCYWMLSCMCLMLPMVAGAQAGAGTITVTGKVITKDTREAVPGITIKSKLTNKGLLLTDVNGQFTVKVASNDVLIFSAIGFQTLEVSVNGRTKIDVQIAPAVSSLKEAVVIGYQTKTRETVTGAVTSITSKDIQDVPVTSVIELLQGKVAGLNVQNNTGAPGFRGSVAIRGISQLNVSGSGNNQFLSPSSPLYIIDGVPVDENGAFDMAFNQGGPGTSPLSLIPPEDVESIDVLKDAVATSLYGSRAANGVIVINTKRGNSPRPVITLQSQVFYNMTPSLRSTIGGMGERDFRINAIKKYGSLNDYYNISRVPFLADSLNPFYNNATDWQGIFFRNTYNQSHNVSIKGGSPQLNYKANLGYTQNKGIMKNTGFNRYNLNMQMHYEPTHKLRMDANVFTGWGQKQRGNGGGLSDNGAGDAFKSSLLPAPSFFVAIPEYIGLETAKDDNNTLNMRSNVSVDYELLKGLRASSSLSYEYYTDTRDQFKQALANNNSTALVSFTGRRDQLINRNQLNYSMTLNKVHNFYFSVFNEIMLKNQQNMYRKLYNGPSDFYQGPLGFRTNDSTGLYDVIKYREASIAGMFSYNLSQKYVLDVSYRRDGNSASGIENQFTTNPSIGGRWNFSKEKFLEPLKWLSYGSLRFTYGINSRPSADIFASLGEFYQSGTYNNYPRISPVFGNMPNPHLDAEKSKQWNFGVDLNLFKDRVSINYDRYEKTTINLVRSVFLPTSTGYDNVKINGASLLNYGHEINLTVRPLSPQSKLQWTMNINGAINQNRLLKIDGDAKQFIYYDYDNYQWLILKVGRNIFNNYMFQNQGVYATNKDVPVDPVLGTPYATNSPGGYFKAGDPIWKDIDGDYRLSDEDRTIVGDPLPLVNGGISQSLTWGRWNFSMYASFIYKRSIYNNAFASMLSKAGDPTDYNYSVPDVSKYNFWKNQGDVTKYPTLDDYTKIRDIAAYRYDQSLFQEDGSYFKINQITIGYTIDPQKLKAVHLSRVRFYGTLYNMAIFSPYSGPNPENVSDLGKDRADSYPIARSITLGLNVEF